MIIQTGGVIVSEHPGGTKADSEKFRRRNRIVSALSLGVLIVEAEIRSGTSITARYAKEQGKCIFCIPSSINNNKGIGTNIMIRKGAELVQFPSDVTKRYGIKGKEKVTIEDWENQNKVTLRNLAGIAQEYKEIYKVLNEPLSVNEISERTKTDVTEVYSRLFMMEMEGIIGRKENKYVIV